MEPSGDFRSDTEANSSRIKLLHNKTTYLIAILKLGFCILKLKLDPPLQF
jgi:hypothetical protein